MGSQVQQEIIERLRNLDPFQLSEVFDFVTFLQQKQKHGPTAYNPEVIDRIWGKYREIIPPSTELARRKRREIDLEEEKWRTR